MISRILFVLLVLATLITPASAQIRAGACKMNFWSSTGIGLVHPARIVDLGFTEGEFAAHVDALDDYHDWYAFLDNVPGTFVSYLLPVWPDYLDGTNCTRLPGIPLQGMTYEPVFSLHPEYDLHYPREDKDWNVCVGQAIWDDNAEQDPSDLLGATNCWRLNPAIHVAGVAIATPNWLTTTGETFNEWVMNPRNETRGMVNVCEIRLRGDVSSVPPGTPILTYQQWTGNTGNWTAQFATPPTITVADFPGNSATWFTVRIDNIALDHFAMCEFQWSGQGEIWIDRVDYYTECSFGVVAGAFDTDINDIAAAAQVPLYGNGRIDGFTIADEPWAAMMIPTAHVRNHLAGLTPTYHSKFWLNPVRINAHTTHTMLDVLEAVDINIYPYENGITEMADTGAFQGHLQTMVVEVLRGFQQVNGLFYQREMGSTVQTFWNEGNGWRYPTADELLLQVNLSLAYGSKSIWYYLLTGEDTYHGILDGDGNIVNTEIYDAVRTINMRLTGDWGTSLSALTYREGFSRHEEVLGGAPFDLNIASVDPFGHVRDIVSSPNPDGSNPDAEDATYVELTRFEDATGADYLYILNRRTTRDNNIFVHMNTPDPTTGPTPSLTIMDMVDERYQIVCSAAPFHHHYAPAEARLLRVTDGIWTAPTEINTSLEVMAGAAWVVNTEITINTGATVTIQEGGQIIIEPGGVLVLNGGSITSMGSGQIRTMHPLAIIGSGSLVTPNLEINGELVINQSSVVSVFGGGSFNFISGSPRMLVVLGRLLFECDSCSVRLDSIDEVRVAQNGLLSVAGEITVGPSMHINVWEQATLALNGSGETDSCIFQMKAGAEINTESTLDANFATFEGVPNPPADNEEWEGILVSGPNARISMNHVLIKDVHCDPSTQGTGIHFFAASNSGNRIENTRIVREYQSDKLGDGIFLQPWQSAQSYVELHCVETLDDWWTGLTSVSSECNATGLTTMFNKRGVGAHLTGNVLYLYQSRLEANLIAGLYAEAGSGTNVTTFGSYGSAPDGFNSIFGNGYVQIHLIGTYLNGGLSNFNDNNDIGHSSSSVLRMIVDSGAQASVTRNYWLTPTPVPSMFQIISGSCTWVPYLTQSNRPDDMECFSLSKSGRHSVLPPMDLSTMMEYGLNGRMSDVYAFVNTRIAAGVSVPNRVRILKALLATEIGHAREYPDSMVTAFNRLRQLGATHGTLRATCILPLSKERNNPQAIRSGCAFAGRTGHNSAHRITESRTRGGNNYMHPPRAHSRSDQTVLDRR